jgi:hypothetical protein
MAFCTLLEWDEEFPFDRYQEMNTRAGVHDSLPDGCLVRVVGQVDGGARVVEVWASGDDAKRFSDENSHLISEFQLPPPSRVEAFETKVFQSGETTDPGA